MSNTLAIATVTATLQTTIQNELASEFPGALVKTGRPASSLPDSATPEVNLFLYQVTPNTAFRNADLPSRDARGQLTNRLQLGLDLYYLFSFYGDEQHLVPQRLLSHTARALHTYPVLTQTAIINTINSATYSYLQDSDLADQVEQIKFSPLPYSLEELSKLWSVFLQTNYVLSTAYHASVVLIDGEKTPVAAAPVQKRNIHVYGFGNGPLAAPRDLQLSNVIWRLGKLDTRVLIKKASLENNVDYYALYWSKDATTPLTNQNVIAILPKTGGDINYNLANITAPTGATHLLAVSGNRQGEMDHGASASFVDTGLPLQTARGVKFTDQDPHPTLIGGTVTIYKADDESSLTSYRLYWGSDAVTKLSGYNKIVTLSKTGSDLTYILPTGTEVPPAATHLLVFTGNAMGEMLYGVSTRIIDSATLPPVHTASSLKFTGIIITNNGTGQRFLSGSQVTIGKATDERDINEYDLYWGISSTEKLSQSDEALIAELLKTGNDLTYKFQENAEVPSSANYLLVFTRNYYGEMLNGINCEIK